MRGSTKIVILGVFSLNWVCKTIFYEKLSYDHYTRCKDQKTTDKVLDTPYSGG